jgi:hypothetical protein
MKCPFSFTLLTHGTDEKHWKMRKAGCFHPAVINEAGNGRKPM